MSERASLDEVLEFANRVREAGAGNPLTALMPAVPTASSQCLVAKNLNFNCRVAADADTDEAWFMEVADEGLAREIGKQLNLNVYKAGATWAGVGEWRITLPEAIGSVASDFDKAWYLAEGLQIAYNDWQTLKLGSYATFIEFFEEERLPFLKDDLGYKEFPVKLTECLALIKEMWPYVEQSRLEVQEIGIFNDQGELII